MPVFLGMNPQLIRPNVRCSIKNPPDPVYPKLVPDHIRNFCAAVQRPFYLIFESFL